MTQYEYIKEKIGEQMFHDMIRLGLISIKTQLYFEVYDYHLRTGRRRQNTCEHFNIKTATVGYMIRQMEKTI